MGVLRRPQRSAARGFTLVELMAVVVITAVLALVGISVFRRYITSSKGTEATAVVQAIRAAEESYIAENHVYLNVSVNKVWYPNVSPGATVSVFGNSSNLDSANWLALAPAVNRTVSFGYQVYAGTGGTAMPSFVELQNSPTFALPKQDWYMIEAKGDPDGNGVFSYYAATSLTSDIYIENEGE